MVKAHGKKEETLYLTKNTSTYISVAAKDIDSDIWHCKMGHMSEKEMKILHSRGKFPGLKALDLKFCEDYVYGK